MLHPIIKKAAQLALISLIIIRPFSSFSQKLDTSKLVRVIEKELKRQGMPDAKFDLNVRSQNQSGGQTAFQITNNYGAHSHVVNGTNNGINGDVTLVSEKYALIAKLDAYGLEIKPGYGFKAESGISLLMKNVIKASSSGGIELIITKEAERYADSVIAKFPSFPFGYWAKAMYLLPENRTKGIEYAKMGVEILEHTTKIEGHNPEQDEVLKILRAYLAGTLKSK